MRKLEASLQEFGEFLLEAQLVTEKPAPYCVRWLRRFLTRPASSEPVADQARRFCEEPEQRGTYADRQIRQAEHALRIYFVNFSIERTGTDGLTAPSSTNTAERVRSPRWRTCGCASALDTTRTRPSAATPSGSDASWPTSANGSRHRTRASTRTASATA